VCDDGPNPPIGGVPASRRSPAATQESANAINDFACRFEGRTQQTNACTKNFGGDGEFVRGTATFVQFSACSSASAPSFRRMAKRGEGDGTRDRADRAVLWGGQQFLP
jgi:hypothetical protein